MKKKSVLINFLALLSFVTISTRADTLFVSNIGNNTITRFDSSGAGTLFSSFQPGPEGLVFDSARNLYVANQFSRNSPFNNTIERFSPAGVGTIFADSNDGLYFPVGLAFDGGGNLFVSNFYSNTIVKINPAGVGSLFFNSGLSGPEQLVVDRAGNLYVANYFGGTVLKINPAGVSAVFAAGLSHPIGLAFDAAGNLYVSSQGNNTIMKFDPSGIGSLFANSGLHGPVGLAFDSKGYLFVANHDNNTIERFDRSGVGTVFASSGLDQPLFLAFEPPQLAPPIITCQGPLTLECASGSAVGTIQAGVMDTNGLPLQVTWSVDGIPRQTNEIAPGGTLTATNVTFTAPFGDGNHVVVVSASNGQTAPSTCSTTVTVSDTLPPVVLSLFATPNAIWPPNHRMIPVNVTLNAMDVCDSTLTAQIKNVISNEPQGKFAPDIEITGPGSVNLRAERSGHDDRIYTIYVEVADSSGNTTTATTRVTVPASISLLR